MADDYKQQFDRFAQDKYLKMLQKTDPELIIPMLFIDLMNRVNMIQGEAGLILAETETVKEGLRLMDADLTSEISERILGGAVDMSNILKALMEHYEISQHGDYEDDK